MTGRWRAQLKLGLLHRVGRTWVAQREHFGPLTIQRAFYPEGPATPHLYVLHPPGGVVTGDQLSLSCHAQHGASALLTTPGATKFYRARSGAQFDVHTAEQHQRLQIEDGASLEWFPQESIAYAGAQVELVTRVELKPTARFCGWDILCLGRPGSGEAFHRGHVRQRFEIFRGDRPVLLERNDFRAGDTLLTAPYGLQNQAVSGTFYCAVSESERGEASRSGSPESQLLENVRAEMARALGGTHEGEQLGVSWLRGCIVARYLGRSTERAKHAFGAVWQVLRPEVFGRAACPPRIWAT